MRLFHVARHILCCVGRYKNQFHDFRREPKANISPFLFGFPWIAGEMPVWQGFVQMVTDWGDRCLKRYPSGSPAMYRTLRSLRKGFTLIELLVVLAIVASLIGLLLPAIQKARESGQRVQCVNNLKQIGLAWHIHETTHQKFPSGGFFGWSEVAFHAGSPEVINKQTAGWAYQILPYIDQQNLWKGGRSTNDMGRNYEIHSKGIKLYVCPSRRTHEPFPLDYDLKKMFSREFCSPLDYAGCAGSHYDPNLHNFYPHTAANSFHGKCCYMNGVVRPVWERGAVSVSEITDGTSNTIMVGEKAMNLTFLGRSQPADDAGFADGWDWDTIRLANPFYD